MTISFSELWEKAENISKARSSIKEELFIKLKQDIEEYSKLEHIPSKEIQHTLKLKKFGEILFKLTELSRLDNINTYAALQLEIKIAEKLT